MVQGMRFPCCSGPQGDQQWHCWCHKWYYQATSFFFCSGNSGNKASELRTCSHHTDTYTLFPPLMGHTPSHTHTNTHWTDLHRSHHSRLEASPLSSLPPLLVSHTLQVRTSHLSHCQHTLNWHLKKQSHNNIVTGCSDLRTEWIPQLALTTNFGTWNLYDSMKQVVTFWVSWTHSLWWPADVTVTHTALHCSAGAYKTHSSWPV